MQKPGSSSVPIAIVGMACRFGGDATSSAKLWDLCAAGKDSWSPIPAENFDAKCPYHPSQQKASSVSCSENYDILTSSLTWSLLARR
jgi:acyl transferase domain-containing protein